MDPLSITASIMTLLGVGGTISTTLEKASMLHQAPLLISTFRCEISDLRTLTYELRNLLRQYVEKDSSNADARRFVEEVTPMLMIGLEKLLEFESLIEYDLLYPGSSSRIRIRRLAWFWNQEKTRAIREQIRLFRTNLTAITTLASMKRLSVFDHELSMIRFNQSTLQATIEKSVHELAASQHQVESAANKVLRIITTSHNKVNLVTQTSPSENTLGFARNRESCDLQMSLIQDSTRCSSTCTCRCHGRATFAWRTLPSWRSYIGLLVVGITGVPILSMTCDDMECARSSQSSIEVKYFFPRWLLPCVLDFHLRVSQSCRISQGLRVSVIHRFWTPCFYAIQTGDQDQLKRVLDSRACSPFDLNSYGNTALDVSIPLF